MEYAIVALIGVFMGIVATYVAGLVNNKKGGSTSTTNIEELLDSLKGDILSEIQDLQEMLDEDETQGEFKTTTVSTDNTELKQYIDKKFDDLRLSMCEMGIGTLMNALKNKGCSAPAPEKKSEVTPVPAVKTDKLEIAEVKYGEEDKLTVVFTDGTEATVTRNKDDKDDPIVGMAYAVAKRVLGSSFGIILDKFAKTLKKETQKPEVKPEVKPETPKTPETPSNPDNNDGEEEEQVPENKVETKNNKAAEKGYDGFLIYLSHKEVSQTNFMDINGDYVDYVSGQDNKFEDIASAKKEADEMSADEEFAKFTVGICAITEDGPKFLKKEEIEEIL